jgi:O-antigen/teichoic acid export membrane protein
MKQLTTLKQSAAWYATSILFAGLVNLLAIPILKQKLGAAEYVYLNLYMNLLLVISYIGAGWLSQSCIRFFSTLSTQQGFGMVFKKMAIYSALATASIGLVLVLFFKHYWWMLLAFPLTLFIINLQAIAIAWLQAILRPKVVAIAEFIRAVLFLSVLLFINKSSSTTAAFTVWAGWLLAYLASLLYLLASAVNNPQNSATAQHHNTANIKTIFKQFSAFGLPISLWLGVNFCLLFVDRFFLLKHQNPALVGHYSALFDVLQKSIGFVLSPLVTAIYPMLAQLQQQNNAMEINMLIKKALKWQLLLAGVALIAFIIGWPLLQKIIAIPASNTNYFVSGILLIIGAAIWQINTLLHKPQELAGNTFFMLKTLVVVFLFLVVGNWLVVPTYGFVGSAAVFLAATSLYAIIIIIKNSSSTSKI